MILYFSFTFTQSPYPVPLLSLFPRLSKSPIYFLFSPEVQLSPCLSPSFNCPPLLLPSRSKPASALLSQVIHERCNAVHRIIYTHLRVKQANLSFSYFIIDRDQYAPASDTQRPEVSTDSLAATLRHQLPTTPTDFHRLSRRPPICICIRHRSTRPLWLSMFRVTHSGTHHSSYRTVIIPLC